MKYLVQSSTVASNSKTELRPFWASILPLDRILTAARGNQFDTHIRYHKKYGPYVRVGPNHISIANGDAIPQIYSITSKFDKVGFLNSFYFLNTHHIADDFHNQSNFYPVFDAVTPLYKSKSHSQYGYGPC